MVSTKLYQDARAVRGDKLKKAPIKVVIAKKGKTALISTGISVTVDEWDKKKLLIINHPNEKKLNLYLSKFLIKVENELLTFEENGELAGLNAQQIKEKIVQSISPSDKEPSKVSFIEKFIQFSETKTNNRTKEIYNETLKRIREFSEDCDNLTFEDITKQWLTSFDRWLSVNSPSTNARNIHHRNIRAVFNAAIEDEITVSYPFRKFKLKNEPTVKRSLTSEQLRQLFSCEPWKVYKEYLDMFKLIFFLCGINLVDLFNLTDKNLINGRIEYQRAKTGKRYSIKIEPEAEEIISRYKGVNYLLNIHDRYKSHKDYMQHLNKGLSKIGKVTGKQKNGVPIMKPVCSELTTYWARHSWATIAAELDIPKETIAAGLGHSIGNPITSIYIDFNLKKVDEANRKIIDYILCNKV